MEVSFTGAEFSVFDEIGPGQLRLENNLRLRSFLFGAVLGDVHDLVLEDEQVRRTLPGQTDHVLVVVLDPSLNDLSVHQFDGDRLLFFAESFQEGRFFKRIFRRRSAAALGVRIPMGSAKRHARIVHKARGARL